MRRGHKVWSGVLLALATVVLILGMTAVWVQRQVLDREEWVDTSVELLENDDVRRAIGLYLIDELYTNVDVAGEIQSALPERLQPLAQPAAGALRRAAEQNAGTLLGTSLAQNIWRRANERAHQVFERVVVDEESGEVTIDLQPLIEKAAERGGLLARAADQLPPDAGQLVVLQSDQLDGAQKVVKVLRPLAIVLVLLALALYVAAVFLSRDRRRTVIYVGACLLFAAVAVLAVRRLGGHTVVDTLSRAPDSKLAVAATWDYRHAAPRRRRLGHGAPGPAPDTRSVAARPGPRRGARRAAWSPLHCAISPGSCGSGSARCCSCSSGGTRFPGPASRSRS